MISVSNNYTGRKVDLFIFQNASVQGKSQIYLGLGTSGEVITGIEKLVQSFLTLFLTRIGSVQSNLSLGSGFVTAMQQGRILDDGNVISEFALASDQVKTTLDLEAEANDIPDDERLSVAVLQSFDLNREESKLTLTVRIESVAGSSRTVYVPVPLAIR